MRGVCSGEVRASLGGGFEVRLRRLWLWEVLERDGSHERGDVRAVSGVALFREGEHEFRGLPFAGDSDRCRRAGDEGGDVPIDDGAAGLHCERRLRRRGAREV